MLTAAGCQGRRDRLWHAIDRAPDVVLLAEPRHLTYFCNLYAPPFIFRSQNAPAMAILEPGRATLVADNVQGLYSAHAHVDELVAPVWYRSRESAPDRLGFLIQAVIAQLSRRRAVRVGIDEAVPTPLVDGLRHDRRALEVSSVQQAIRELERRKDPDEVALMRRSVEAGEAGFAAALEGIRPGMTELEAYLLVQRAAMHAAGETVVVYGDFLAGDRTMKGDLVSQRAIQPNDLFLLDYSVIVHGYRADFANTWVVARGTASPEQRGLERFCLEAMRAGEQRLRPGAHGRDVDAAVRSSFAEHGVADHFTHHTGHGLGLGHPDPPYLTPESTDTLVAGDVVTLEPGLYVEGVGGMRFERNYLITETGYETLTHHALGLDAAA